MNRNDKSKFLLYLEPKNPKSTEPINDEYTETMQRAFDMSIPGTANYSSVGDTERHMVGGAYRGVHHCSCGETSGNKDYLLSNGMITNTLCVHYLQYHRDEICDNDWEKLDELLIFMNHE